MLADLLEKTTIWVSATLGIDGQPADLAARGALVLLTIILCFVADRVAKKFFLSFLKRAAAKTKTVWDDILVERKVFDRLAHLAPAVVVYILAGVVFADLPDLTNVVRRATQIYMIVLGLMVIDGLLNSVQDIYSRFEVSSRVPIKGFVQVAKIVVNCFGVILVFSALLGQSPAFLITGLGAMTAVLMLVFKDPILGFVAGIQLTANNMVRVGDWIEMPKHGADGDVLEVGLTTVKVQNWDKTITSIPTYALISESFKNWRGMQESGGRRIKRAIHLDMTSVKFCDLAMLEKFSKFSRLKEYISEKTVEVAEANRAQNVDRNATSANGRGLTNLGTFRAYLERYLADHPLISGDMTFLVRQLAATEHGLPMEIYVFSTDKDWINYEAIQADIFDHVLAVLPEFELRVFQAVAGHDLANLPSGIS